MRKPQCCRACKLVPLLAKVIYFLENKQYHAISCHVLAITNKEPPIHKTNKNIKVSEKVLETGRPRPSLNSNLNIFERAHTYLCASCDNHLKSDYKVGFYEAGHPPCDARFIICASELDLRLFWLSLLHFLTNFVKPKFYGLQKLRPFRGYSVFCCPTRRRGSCHAQIQNAHKKGVASFKKFDFSFALKLLF